MSKLIASDGEASDYFGYAVSLSGDYAIIGSIRDDAPISYQGSAYVYLRSDTTWNQQAKLTASDGAAGDQFGYSVSIDGDYALIGACYDDSPNTYQGSAYVFFRSGSNWGEQAHLIAADGVAGDYFGTSAFLSGDYALLGAAGDDFEQGSAYVFFRSGTAWGQQAKLLASDGTDGDYFGFSTSLSGGYALIGAIYTDVSTVEDQGAVYVYLHENTSWSEQAKLVASDGAYADYFGYSVSMSGDYALIGSPYCNYEVGSAYLFHRNASSWTELVELLAYDGVEGDQFGYSVSMSGNNIVVGAYIAGHTFDYQGVAYYFLFNESSSIIDHSKLTAFDGATADYYGVSVSVSADYILVGSYYADVSGHLDQGAAYITNISSQVFHKCETGTYTYASFCQLCESGKYNPYQDQISCLDCPMGKHNPTIGSNSSFDCVSCEVGKYNDRVGQANCTSCSPGTYNPETNSTSNSSCLECQPGTSMNLFGQVACTNCTTGKYSSSPGQTECTDCQIGKYSSYNGSVSCSNCSVNYFQPSTGQQFCHHCGYKTCTNGETGQSSCDFCSDLYTLTNVSGCDDNNATGSTSDCPTIGGVIMTIIGEGWILNSTKDIDITVDGDICSILSIINSTSFTCLLPPNVGLDVEIVASDMYGYSGRASKISYASASINSIHGCDDFEDLPDVDGTSACSRDGSDEVTVTGNNFGPDQAGVLISGLKGAIVPLSARGLSGWEQNTTIVQVPAGSGLGVGVNVLQKGGELSDGFRMLSYTSCLENFYDKLNMTSGLYECTCPKGYFIFNGECEKCVGGMKCDEERSVISSISLELGSWRESSTDLSIRECPYEEACTGSSDISNQCADGHSGPLCAVCEDNYVSGSRFEACKSCFVGSSTSSFWILISIIIFLSIVVIGSLVLNFASIKNIISLFNQYINVPSVRVKLKIFLVYCQIIAQFRSILSADYPSNYASFLSILQIFNFDIVSILSLKCFDQQYTFHDQMMVSTILPIFICLLLILGYFKSSFLSGDSTSRQKSQSSLIEWLLFVLYFFFAFSSRIVFEMFNCDDDFESGSSYLRADYRLECSGSTYESYRSYAVFMIFVYPIGIPLLFFSVLFPRRNAINIGVSEAAEGLDSYLCHAKAAEIVVARRLGEVLSDYRSMQHVEVHKMENIRLVRDCNRLIEDRLKIEYSRVLPDLIPYAFLYEAYKPNLWYWECIECVRRLSLTGLLVFMYPGTEKQILLAMILCVSFMILYSWVRPFLDPMHNFIIGSAKWGIFLQLYGTLLLKQGQFDGSFSNIGGLMVTVGVIFPLLPMIVWRGWMSKLRKLMTRKSGHIGVPSRNSITISLTNYLQTQGATAESPVMSDNKVSKL